MYNQLIVNAAAVELLSRTFHLSAWNSVADSGELLRSEQQNVSAVSAERPCCVCGTPMLCPWNVCALSTERLCSVCVIVLFRIVVAKKSIVSQVANRSCREEESQRLPTLEFATLYLRTDPFWRFRRFFVKCLQTPHQVSVNSS